MIHLEVYLTYPDASRIKAGEIVTTNPDLKRGGLLQGEFRYDSAYLASERAFPLDPVDLPLSDRVFTVNNPQTGVPRVFEDSLPDDWGRELLVRRFRLAREAQRVPQLLLCLGGAGLGALSYHGQGQSEAKAGSAHLPDLMALLLASERYELGQREESDDLRLLFQAGSSPGGARPKVVIEDEGVGWIAKFPSMRDFCDVVRLEAATLALAKRAGLIIPDFNIIEVADKAVLLVRRFDLTEAGGRRHLVSMKTLLQADNYYTRTYADLADVVRRCSDHPQQDLAGVYRWMVFNAFIGNTDDHLKNIMMQHDDNGWRVAPFYDLLPNIHLNMEHVLMFDVAFCPPDRKGLTAMASKFGLSSTKAAEIVEHIWDVMADWEEMFMDYKVPSKDIERLRKDIERRRK